MGEGTTTNLPPGFRFFPSDEELVVHFLYRKAALLPCHPDIIPTLDLYHCDPWGLNGKALQGGSQWYFFTHRTQNRVSANGYWKPTGNEEQIRSRDNNVGVKKTLVFYAGEAPKGIKTNWVMYEYNLLDGVTSSCSSSSSNNNNSSRRSSSKKGGHTKIEYNKWVLCRVYEANSGSQVSFYDDGTELSYMDEVFLSFDDLDEISLPN